jgi:hypothetical protein
VLVHRGWDLVLHTAGEAQDLADIDRLLPAREQEWVLDLDLIEQDPGRWQVLARRSQVVGAPASPSLFCRSVPADEENVAGYACGVRRLTEPWMPHDLDTVEDLLERELSACTNVQLAGLTARDVVYFEVMPSAAKVGALVRQAASLHSVHLDFEPANMRSVEPDEWDIEGPYSGQGANLRHKHRVLQAPGWVRQLAGGLAPTGRSVMTGDGARRSSTRNTERRVQSRSSRGSLSMRRFASCSTKSITVTSGMLPAASTPRGSWRPRYVT